MTKSMKATGLLPAILALGLVACGGGGGGTDLSGGDPGGGNPVTGQVTLSAATLTGDQGVPTATTGGSGSATVVLSADQSRIDVTLNIKGTFTSPIGQAHFHIGAVGENGPIILWICTNLGNAPAGIPAPPACPTSPGTVTRSFTAADLTPAGGVATFAGAVNVLLAGKTYINVHTQTHPGGEIRGQVGTVQSNAILTGTSEVPMLNTATTGFASMTLNQTQTQLDFNLSTGAFSTLVTQAHIHVGEPGAIGPPILFLCSNLPGKPVGVPACGPTPTAAGVTGTLGAADFIPGGGLTSFAEAVNAIISGKTYVNVHTQANPGGEIRDALMPAIAADARVMYVDNTAAVNGNGSLATPFNNLAAAAAGSLEGDIIFVFAGNAADTGQDVGITLKSGQKLIGEGAGLALGNALAVAPGALPLISNAALASANDIPVVMLATGNKVTGLAINVAFNDGVLATSGDNHIVHGNTFIFNAAKGREGVRLLDIGGRVGVTNNTISGSPRSAIKFANNEDQAGNVVAAPATVATVNLSGNAIGGTAQDGIDATLDGTGTDVTLKIRSNSITNSGDENIDVDVFGAASVTALVQGNTLTLPGGVADFAAAINNTSDICLELVNNVSGLASFRVNNNTGLASAFRFFEVGNDNPAIRSGLFTNVAQGTCGVQ